MKCSTVQQTYIVAYHSCKRTALLQKNSRPYKLLKERIDLTILKLFNLKYWSWHESY